MKKKLRVLRRKREFVKLCKGALRKSYLAYWDRNYSIKRFGEKTNITNMDFIANMNLAGVKKISLWRYIKFKFNRIFEILEDLM